MKTPLAIILLALVVGVGVGVGTAVWRARLVPWDGPPPGVASPRPATAQGETPKVAVDQEEYNFGVMDASDKKSHGFVFTNTGKGPLVLRDGGSSCRCAVAEIEKAEVPPGGSTKVTVRWTAKDMIGDYRQTARVKTNDPSHASVALTVAGKVKQSLWADPPELVLSRVSASEPTTGEVRLFCSLAGPLRILDCKFSNQDTAEFFQVANEAISPSQEGPGKEARSAVLLRVTVKPGLPQGPFQQTILLGTSIESARTFSLPIKGTVGSDISVAGEGWSDEQGLVYLGQVQGSAGARRQLRLIVRGSQGKEVKFKVVRIEPGFLQVTLGQTTAIGSGAATQTPITIQIPKGSLPANHMGSEQGKLGEIILETGHPQTPQLRIRVRFAVEG
jgi:hypothetical protein